MEISDFISMAMGIFNTLNMYDYRNKFIITFVSANDITQDTINNKKIHVSITHMNTKQFIKTVFTEGDLQTEEDILEDNICSIFESMMQDLESNLKNSIDIKLNNLEDIFLKS